MGKRFDTLLFPGGKSKAFTLSYDDGVIQDRRLVELFDKYGVKCTFNLNYGVLDLVRISPPREGRSIDISTVSKEEVKELYANHEVGGHGLYHSNLAALGAPYASYEILEDKRQLETLTGKPVRMFAYPFGIFSEETKDLLKKAGYYGARTIKSTHEFNLPEDPWELNPTCHHNDEKLMELLEKFVTMPPFRPSMFYLWGHGYEFDGAQNWGVIEKTVSYVSQHGDDIWFATNGEILDYLRAFHMLEYSVDGSMIYNPSAKDIEIKTSFTTKEILKAGEVTRIGETSL